MTVTCVWEHHGKASLIYADQFPGAYTRGATKDEALSKMPAEVRSYIAWKTGQYPPGWPEIRMIQENASELAIEDADTDVLFDREIGVLDEKAYITLTALVLKSARDFQRLYDAVPDKDRSVLPERSTFYGSVPRTARQMYDHTRGVNAFYFGKIQVPADDAGRIDDCRERGFAALESLPGYLENRVSDDGFGEQWSLKKVCRRFIWHDRIHAKAMYRMAERTFGPGSVPDIFCFGGI